MYDFMPGSVYGRMPNGEIQAFEDDEAYESAYIDALYEYNNEYEFEWPEDIT